MDTLLRFFIIALMIVAGIALVAVCGDGLGDACSHVYSSGGDRSRPLQRIFRRLLSSRLSAPSLLLALWAVLGRGIALIIPPMVSTSALVKVSALRV